MYVVDISSCGKIVYCYHQQEFGQAMSIVSYLCSRADYDQWDTILVSRDSEIFARIKSPTANKRSGLTKDSRSAKLHVYENAQEVKQNVWDKAEA